MTMTLERLVLKKLDRAYYRWCGNKIQTASRVDSRTGDGVSRELSNGDDASVDSQTGDGGVVMIRNSEHHTEHVMITPPPPRDDPDTCIAAHGPTSL